MSGILTPARTVELDARLPLEGRVPVELGRFVEAIDARTMCPRLASALGTAGRGCHVLDAKYQPGVGATVLYELDGQLVRGDLTASPDMQASASRRVVAPGVRVSVFPDDPDLPSLPLVLDPTHLARALGEAHGVAHRWRTSLLRYRPGKRATVLAVRRHGGRSCVAKVYHQAAKAAAVASEAEALQSAARTTQTLRFPAVLAHLTDLDTVVQERVTGTPLDALLDPRHHPGRAARSGVRRAAHAIAELHDRSPSTERERPVDRELHRFMQRASAISAVAPAPGDALLALATRLAAVAPQLPPPETGTVHGDCKPSQFVLAHRVHLLDVDHVGVSDLAGDVGTFMASLRQVALRRRPHLGTSPGSMHDELAEIFLSEYLATRTRDVAMERIRWQEAVALERKALRSFARAPRSPLALALTNEAHRRLDAMDGRSHD